MIEIGSMERFMIPQGYVTFIFTSFFLYRLFLWRKSASKERIHKDIVS